MQHHVVQQVHGRSKQMEYGSQAVYNLGHSIQIMLICCMCSETAVMVQTETAPSFKALVHYQRHLAWSESASG